LRITRSCITRTAALVALPLLAVLAFGCAGKLLMENYNKVANGMTQQEVEAILGPGTEQASSGVSVPGQSVAGVEVPGVSMSSKAMIWQKGGKMITVSFVNDKVAGKIQVGL
jgi:hypothetical protein